MIQIRLLEASDWQGLFNLVKDVDKDLVGMHNSTEELVDDWIHTIEIGVWEIYVAILPRDEIDKELKHWNKRTICWKRIPNNLSGIVGVITLYGDSSDEDILEGEFDIGITVAKPFQRKGIGRELIQFIMERGKNIGYKRATLWTREDNLPMIKLATKLGFDKRKSKEKDGYSWNQYILELEEKKSEEE
ncbi:MAG: GNAT family N-acetyltransferase [Candidatus Heimdallarchaeota archaeon]|nr:GNAT family N-acetyltransferase [Candidatus Heimdallarchaeota archaeon]